MSILRGFVARLTSYYGVDKEDIDRLEYVKEMISSFSKEDIMKELQKRIDFIKLINTGTPGCKECWGTGVSSDSRGDRGICYKCHPRSQLDSFWNR